jgi:hypothetical protein
MRSGGIGCGRAMAVVLSVACLAAGAWATDATPRTDVLLQQVAALFFTESPPGAAARPGAAPLESATLLLNELKTRAPEIDPIVLAPFSALLSRPVDLTAHLDTQRFRIHYAPGGPDAPFGWPSTAFVSALGVVCEEVWTGSHVDFPWPEPRADAAEGGDARIDVYLRDLGWGVYGYALHEETSDPRAKTGFIVLDNDFVGFGSLEPSDAARVTLAHEYQHLIQFGFGYEASANWFMEATATMMEGQLCPEIRDFERYLSYFVSRPHRRLDLSDGSFEYGAWLWPQYIVESRGAAALVAMWQQWSDGGQTLLASQDAVFRAAGSSLDEAFLEWATWNGVLSEGSARAGFGYARAYPVAVTPAVAVSHYPAAGFGPAMTAQPEPLGAGYVELRPEPGSADNQLEIALQACGGPGEARLITWPLDGGPPELSAIQLIDGRGLLTITGWDAVARALLIVVNGSQAISCCDYRIDASTHFRPASVDPDTEGPARPLMLTASPNPFEPYTVIQFNLAGSAPVALRLFDAQGRLVETLIDAQCSPGLHAVRWDGGSTSGAAAQTGIYFCEIRTPAGSERLRLVHLH